MIFKFILSFLIIFECLGRNQNTIKDVEHKYHGTQKKIKSLRWQVRKFENDLKNTNNQFSNLITLKNNLYLKIEESESDIDRQKSLIDMRMLSLKKILLKYESLDESVEEYDLKFFMVKNINKQKKKIMDLKRSYNDEEAHLVELRKKLSDYEFLESDLLQKLEGINQKVEEKKSSLSTYLKKNKNLKHKVAKLRKKASKEVIKKIEPSKLSKFSLIRPVKSKGAVRKDESGGINFRVEKNESIFAPAHGEVIYSGSLSNYGNVIVIRHADGHRSVLLGKFLSKVIKSQKVKKGEVIANILEAASGENRLYFELRKEKKKLDVAQFIVGEKV